MKEFTFVFYVFEFLILFLIVYLYYRLIGLKKIDFFKKKEHNFRKKKTKEELKKERIKKRQERKNNFNKDLAEVKLFVLYKKIDLEKVDYKKMSKQVVLVISISLALTTLLAVELFDSIWLKILVGLGTVIVSTCLGYTFLGFIYKKKGLTKDV